MKTSLSTAQIVFFEKNGYLKIEKFLSAGETEDYRSIYEDFLSGKIDTGDFRSDLGAHVADDKRTGELITQIMVPGRIHPILLTQPLHTRSLDVSQQLLGEDMALDFDMLIDKAPYTNAPTPWHQDRAYWITMPDTRAVSCWVALDEAVIDNGCMWYVPGSHLFPVRKHWPAGKGGGALQCEASESEGLAIELKPGDCVLHHGGTLHYSRGNSTSLKRRAFITNFRPAAMIAYERAQGYDHTGERAVKDSSASSK
ncbi:MAG TPA: phytanoyl-CoA dioxygenase family protein [Chitinophaga sp.]|uniref:phytanoyl-CoA dioxygenase family protein n=1 Tax=Chitinophaga sp. TaxID=1869181 RepID=UPI002BF67846|nr:phytanoyl-CoA dioxygenase family protein [Chitinophaga sp.]HVI47788.1 phytanoyl-CoA dioxygenase family protein [Chitinophaga sp.]